MKIERKCNYKKLREKKYNFVDEHKIGQRRKDSSNVKMRRNSDKEKLKRKFTKEMKTVNSTG
jgi:hypothetical protein